MAHRNKKNNARQGAKAPSQPTPRPSKIEIWSRDICQKASGAGTLQGLSTLGPIRSYEDLLIPVTSTICPKKELAAEQILHLIEGWRYVASATSAFLTHSESAATHFAYYAELRAAMSLFAWSGIRLRMNAYYYLDMGGNKQTNIRNEKTHDAAWALWNEWTKRQDANNLFFGKIKMHPAISLNDVFKSISFSDPRKKLQGWGADLISVANDKKARNSASYEAYWMARPLTAMPSSNVDLIQNIWRLFLSDGNALSFDSALISYVIEDAISAQKGISPTPAGINKTKEQIRSEIARKISASTGVPEEDILRRIDPMVHSTKPFDLASSPATEAINVLCRAFFMLRIAVLALKENIELSNNPHTTEWLKNWLNHAGIWSPDCGFELSDIELDYKDAITDLDPTPPLPRTLWTGQNLVSCSLLARPDACIAWSLIA